MSFLQHSTNLQQSEPNTNAHARPRLSLLQWVIAALGLVLGCAVALMVDGINAETSDATEAVKQSATCATRPAKQASDAAQSSVVSGQWPVAGNPPSKHVSHAIPPTVMFDPQVAQVQHLSPAAPYPIRAIDTTGQTGEPLGWGTTQPFDWQPYAQGEYVGHARMPHVCEYRLRADDLLECVFRVTRDEQTQPYRLNVGDEIRIESLSDPTLNRENLIVQPDGTITLPLVGQVKATRLTVTELRDVIDDAYKQYYKNPSITVTPLKVNTKLEDLRATVDKRQGFGGQSREARVTPEGTIALPAVGNVPAQGLTLGELKRELDERYSVEVEGLEVTPVLLQRAPRYVYVLGEVRTPGRYALEGPTTVMQSISMAGGWNVGGNLRQTIIFRRGDDWRLLATMLDIRGAVYAKTPCPADEVWINDSDIVVVPKSPVLVFDDWAQLIFTHGIYRVFPFTTSMNFSFFNTLPGSAAAASTTVSGS